MKYLISLLLLLPLYGNGQGFPDKPTSYVTIYDPFFPLKPVISKSEEELLNAKLRAFEDSTSNQLFIYITGGLYAKNMEDYSREIFNTWGIGQKDKNNGILIAIFIHDRKYRLQVGYGLEAALPSELCRKIQDVYMGPHFKKENYYEGINAGIDQLIYFSRHEYKPPTAFEQMQTPIIGFFLTCIVLFAINLASLKKWSNQPKRRQKYLLLSISFLAGAVLLSVIANFILTEHILTPLILGTVLEVFLCVVINDKSEVKYDNESDYAYERRMRQELLRADRSNSDSSSDRGSGGGGSSGSGGSSSSW